SRLIPASSSSLNSRCCPGPLCGCSPPAPSGTCGPPPCDVSSSPLGGACSPPPCGVCSLPLICYAFDPIHKVAPIRAPMPTTHATTPSEAGPKPPNENPPGLLSPAVTDLT